MLVVIMMLLLLLLLLRGGFLHQKFVTFWDCFSKENAHIKQQISIIVALFLIGMLMSIINCCWLEFVYIFIDWLFLCCSKAPYVSIVRTQ